VNSLHFRLRILPPQVIEIIAAYGLRRVLCVWCLWLPLKSLILPCVWSAYGCVACTPHTPPTHCAPFGSARTRNERDLRNPNRVDEMTAVEAEERGEDGQTDGLSNVAARVRIPGHVRDLRRAAGLPGAWSRREVVDQAAPLKAEAAGGGDHHSPRLRAAVMTASVSTLTSSSALALGNVRSIARPPAVKVTSIIEPSTATADPTISSTTICIGLSIRTTLKLHGLDRATSSAIPEGELGQEVATLQGRAMVPTHDHATIHARGSLQRRVLDTGIARAFSSTTSNLFWVSAP
jgi:hypothetical protein